MSASATVPCAASRAPRIRAAARLAGVVATAVLAGAAWLPGTALAADPVARFEGGIGSQPLRAGGVPNDVNGVLPGGRPWVIQRLVADVRSDGRVQVDGRGLLLAGGPAIGTGGGQSVRARLFCDNVAVGDSELVPLATNGDFRIDGFLGATPPSPCRTPVLLVINAGGSWFAAGIPKD